MASVVYSVKAGPDITRIRRGKGTRRRAGVEFGSTARLISAEPGPGITQVSPAELETILADPHLVAKLTDPSTVEQAPADADGDVGGGPPPNGDEGGESAAEEVEESPGGKNWPLRMPAEQYLQKYPDGKHADLAREIVGEE